MGVPGPSKDAMAESESHSKTGAVRGQASGPEARVKAPTGRVLGPRAIKTRQKLLDATSDLLRLSLIHI